MFYTALTCCLFTYLYIYCIFRHIIYKKVNMVNDCNDFLKRKWNSIKIYLMLAGLSFSITLGTQTTRDITAGWIIYRVCGRLQPCLCHSISSILITLKSEHIPQGLKREAMLLFSKETWNMSAHQLWQNPSAEHIDQCDCRGLQALCHPMGTQNCQITAWYWSRTPLPVL